MEGASNPPPAGWYRDPDDEALQRFWNGSRWTNSRVPLNTGVPLEDDPQPEPAPLTPTEPPLATGDRLPPPAWYADPENAQGMRYWDGAKWTEHRTNYRAEPAKPASSDGLVIAGYILAVMIPIGGLVIGAMLLGRHNQHGRWVLAISILFIALAFVAADQGIT